MTLPKAVGILFASAWLASPSFAQGAGATDCSISAPGGFRTDTFPGQARISYGSGGIVVRCPKRNITLIADSGRQTGAGGDRIDLYGHVHYMEPARIDLRSDLLTYFQQEDQVIVIGHVVATLPSGSTLTGPQANYLRPIPVRRPLEELTAIQRPTVVIAAQGDTAKPVSVTANTIFMRGDSLIYASRAVTITRVDLITHSDSAFLDGRVGQESMRLMYTPSVEGLQGRKFTLEGDIIDAYSKSRKLERVIARGKGHATSQDLEITADTIDLRMSNDALERSIAWSRPGQARAKSPGQMIDADSIDVLMPKQKVSIVYAVRRAYAQADADTVRFRTTEKDWLRGETVTAWFDTTTTKDTSTTPPIKQILATHHADSAQAYYHLAPNDTGVHSAAISYVRGGQIRLDFDNRKVAMVSVKDSVYGLYLEPKRDTAQAAAKPGAKAGGKTVPGKPPTAVRKPPAAPDVSFRRPEGSRP